MEGKRETAFPAKETETVNSLSARQFHQDIRPKAEPAVFRGLARDWPAVRAAAAGDQALVDYLTKHSTNETVWFNYGPPEIEGRFHYNSDLSGLNFTRHESPMPGFLKRVLAAATEKRPPTMAAQGIEISKTLPGFASENVMPLLDPSISQRAWIGNSTRVATHHDSFENIVCVVAGRRRFTLFPPDQVANLYIGPFHFTPAGVAVSMVDLNAPDFERYPRFREALKHALVFDLEPGDALYIPYHWYHHVEAFGPLTMLINYWWNDASRLGGSPWDAMLHGLMALRGLPDDQRRAWNAMFNHYVFLSNENPGDHLPPAARGILNATGDAELAEMRRQLIEHLENGKRSPATESQKLSVAKAAASPARMSYNVNVQYGQRKI